MEFVPDIGALHALRARIIAGLGPTVTFPEHDGIFSRGDTVRFDREKRKENGRVVTTDGKEGVIVDIIDRDDGAHGRVRELMIVVPQRTALDGRIAEPEKLYRRSKRNVERQGGPGHAAA